MKLSFIALLFLINSSAFSQSSDSVIIQNYLRNNMEVVDPQFQNEIKIFDAEFYKNQLFLFGENHGSSNPQNADILLFKQLYKKAGVRFYVAEVDDTKAWMLNNYLRTGDEQLLKQVFSSWLANTAQWANKSNFQKFKNLRAFYLSLKASQKFNVIGIDNVQDYSLLKFYAKFFGDKIKTKSSAKLYTDSLIRITDTLTYAGRKEMGKFSRRVASEILKYENLYKTALGKSFKPFSHFINSLALMGKGIYRDSVMALNFEDIIKTYGLHQKKMYGFLGFYHCLQTGYENSTPFAAAVLQNMQALKNKIVSIQMFALQSNVLLPFMQQVKQLMPKSYVDKLRKDIHDFDSSSKYIPFELSNDNNMMKVEGINNLKAVSVQKTTVIFKLNAVNSPFGKTRSLAEVKGFQSVKLTDPGSNTLQSFQYILLFRNSKAAVPIENF
jgi:hypothetical protein